MLIVLTYATSWTQPNQSAKLGRLSSPWLALVALVLRLADHTIYDAAHDMLPSLHSISRADHYHARHTNVNNHNGAIHPQKVSRMAPLLAA